MAGMTQGEAAARLGVTQAYLSLLETGKRRLPFDLARKLVAVYRMSPSALPVKQDSAGVSRVESKKLAADLSALGYKGFSYVRFGRKKNPAEVLFTALAQNDLEPRLTEALPWVVLNYPDLNWEWLVRRAKEHNLQNRLGYVTTLARQLAESDDASGQKAQLLSDKEVLLEQSRLSREDTLCRDSLSAAEKSWLATRRPEEAKHWNLLTDLVPQHLGYAAHGAA